MESYKLSEQLSAITFLFYIFYTYLLLHDMISTKSVHYDTEDYRLNYQDSWYSYL